jgi:hypothetical protein
MPSSLASAKERLAVSRDLKYGSPTIKSVST